MPYIDRNHKKGIQAIELQAVHLREATKEYQKQKKKKTFSRKACVGKPLGPVIYFALISLIKW